MARDEIVQHRITQELQSLNKGLYENLGFVHDLWLRVKENSQMSKIIAV